MNELHIDDVANWFLSKKAMTPKKLQKMVYYAKAWSLVFFNDDAEHLDVSLFPEDFEAWVHGPVNRHLYARFADFGYREINQDGVCLSPELENPDVADLLNQVMHVYGDYDGNALERLTHSELPWLNARGDSKPLDTVRTIISDKDMFEYYASQVA